MLRLHELHEAFGSAIRFCILVLHLTHTMMRSVVEQGVIHLRGWVPCQRAQATRSFALWTQDFVLAILSDCLSIDTGRLLDTDLYRNLQKKSLVHLQF